MKSAKPIRGTRDILPEDMKKRESIEKTILDVYKKAGYQPIQTPILEDLDLLLGSSAGENLKMLYTVLKRGDKFKPKDNATVKDLCDTGLRFDLTLPLSRFFSNNKEKLELPFKAIQVGDVYRAERPQKGRFREFKQCDIDIIGDKNITAEIDLIHTTAKALLAIGFKDFTIKISDRKLLENFIKSFGISDVSTVAISLDKLDKIGAEGVVEELEKKGIEKSKALELVNATSKATLDSLSNLENSQEIILNLKRIIEAINETSNGKYKIEFDLTIVRGMGYYTGPVFEIKVGNLAVAGGGRYDDMIGITSKKSEPAVGFSIGFERILDLIEEKEEEKEKKLLLLCNPNKDEMSKVIKIADKYNAEGYIVNLTERKKNLGNQLKKAEEHGYDYLYIYGRDDKLKEI